MKDIFRLYSILALITLSCAAAFGQSAILSGKITSNGEPVEYATVYIKNTNHGVSADSRGFYKLPVRSGNAVLVVQAMGYATQETEVSLRAGERRQMNFQLDTDEFRLGEVVVNAKSTVRQIKETAYNVVAIDTKPFQNSSLDIAGVLDRVSGVKIRESGGVGSDARISLNGFTGKHVKIFMDGVPMEGRGSSFGINNIPVHLAERIEVYKGVVPVELGSDALGGAINIVTKKSANTYVDASYSYGSFNTHRSNLNFGHRWSGGLTMQLEAFQNYSDNSYKIKTKLLDLETGNFSEEEYWFKRFHDTYHNEAIQVRIGVVDKKWASRLMFGITYSQEKKEEQNANIMQIAFGGRFQESKTWTPSLEYEKRNLWTKNLNFSLSANYNNVISNTVDTLARQYNWAGEYREKSSQGERSRTLSETKNNTIYITGNLNYRIGEKHFFSLNHVFSDFYRKPTDKVYNEESTDGTYMKRTTQKNVTGISYKFSPNEKWNASAFAKYYDISVSGPVNQGDNPMKPSYEQESRNTSVTGYGAAATYLLIPAVQLKLSYEKALRLPSITELFGDESLEVGDASIKPENSNNANFNIGYNQKFASKHSVYADAGIAYRDTRDYIRRQTDLSINNTGGGTYYTNHGKVRTLGFDFEARYFYKEKFSIGGNFTYQDIRNMEKYGKNSDGTQGRELIYYKDRMPNAPYLFGNAEASYNFRNVFEKTDRLTLTYFFRFVRDFYRSWESEGGEIMIPGHMTHDLSLNYSVINGSYNIALEARNLANEIIYDNYSLQKPGRSFTVKLRYYFFRAK